MYALPYVLAILTALSLLTMSKFQSHLESRLFEYQVQWESIQSGAREAAYNNREASFFKKLPSSTEKSQEESPAEEDSIPIDNQDERVLQLSSKFNLGALFYGDPEHSTLARELWVQIIEKLYGEQPFYQELRQKWGNVAEHLVAEVLRAAKDNEGNWTVRSQEGLRTLELPDEDLQRLWYRIMQGSGYTDGVEAYPAMERLIGVNRTNQIDEAISVYLAAPEILHVLFGDQQFVDALLDFRYSLRGGGDEAAEELRIYIGAHPAVRYWDEILNFRVSGTRPSR